MGAVGNAAAGPATALEVPSLSDIGYLKGDASVGCDGDVTLGHLDQVPFPITAKVTSKEFSLAAVIAECTAAALALIWDTDFSTDTVDPTSQTVALTSDGPSFAFSNGVVTDFGTVTIPGNGDVITANVGFKFLYSAGVFRVIS